MKWQSKLLPVAELDKELAALASGGWFIHTITLDGAGARALVVSCWKQRDNEAKPANGANKKPYKPYYRKAVKPTPAA
jgi:hypothetical protein